MKVAPFMAMKSNEKISRLMNASSGNCKTKKKTDDGDSAHVNKKSNINQIFQSIFFQNILPKNIS